MTARLCAVPECGSPAASDYSRHCRRHKSTLRRHGATGQRGITKAELAPYLARIEARIAKNPDSEAWPLMETAWAAIVAEANVNANRRVGNRYERCAANEIAAIGSDCTSNEVIGTVLAMILFWHDRPRRFASDEALRVQIARRVRDSRSAMSGCATTTGRASKSGSTAR